MACDRLRGNADIVITMPAHDVRVVFAPAEHVEPSERTGPGKHPRCAVNPASLRATYAPGKVLVRIAHTHLLVRRHPTARDASRHQQTGRSSRSRLRPHMRVGF